VALDEALAAKEARDETRRTRLGRATVRLSLST
jgi:hypothetical protein